MRLGDACTTVYSSDWQRDTNHISINEASLRKLMRGQNIKPAHQYWAHFEDVQSLHHCLVQRSAGAFPVINEKPVDRFMLGLDWLSGVLRALQSHQVVVILAVADCPQMTCTFMVA